MTGGGVSGIIVGLLFIAGAATWSFLKKSEFSILLSSASGQVKALSSQDGQFITKVVNALNEAIFHRG